MWLFFAVGTSSVETISRGSDEMKLRRRDKKKRKLKEQL